MAYRRVHCVVPVVSSFYTEGKKSFLWRKLRNISLDRIVNATNHIFILYLAAMLSKHRKSKVNNFSWSIDNKHLCPLTDEVTPCS